MPSDLSPHVSKGVIQIRDRAGVGLPFSKGLMATSILATGVETDVAYRIAAEIERTLRDQSRQDIGADELAELAAETITRHLGVDVSRRYRVWRRAKRTDRPLLIALGGAPGVGKSTVATRLAVRLGITRVVTTDTIREVLRTVIPQTVLPELHVSSFESSGSDAEASPFSSFQRQAQAVGAATAAVARRLAIEKRSAVLEGVHLLPGELTRSLRDTESKPIVVELLLTLGDEQLHRAHLVGRAYGEPSRNGQRHVRHFESIRRLQATLQEQARGAQVADYDIADPADFTQRVVEQVVDQVAAEQKGRE